MKDREYMNETLTEQLGETARRVAEAGRDTASRATDYVRDGLGRAADLAHDWSSKAGEQIADITGRQPDAWTRQVRGFVEQNPMKSLLITIAIGYMLGKLLGHGDRTADSRL
jgi:ElaB/YqjD/DUF883 family membrane-anchored ribosome-binding protein